MKKLVCALILFTTPIFAQSNNLDRVIGALIKVESGGNSKARNGDAVGILQMKPAMVNEVNRILKKNTYTLDDRWDKEKSIEMAKIFFNYWVKHWPKQTDLELCGRWMLPNGGAPKWYIDRCAKVLK